MREESYTLREVAELLGVSKRTLQRRIREGAFPGRFLAPGRHGLETRIPSNDVHLAIEDLRRSREPREEEEIRLPTVTPSREIGESLRPSAVGLTHRDLESLRDAVLAIVREDREALLGVVRETLETRDRELSGLRAQMTAMLQGLERLRRLIESRPAQPGTAGEDPALGVLREIEELESLLQRLPH